MKARLKINGFIMFTVVLSITFFPRIFFRRAMEGFTDETMEILGIAFILLGQIFRASSRGYKSEHSQNGKALLQNGPYALVRNPMYLGILLIGLGIVLMLFNWWVLGIFFLVFISQYVSLIFKEERKLKVLFPLDYPDYQERAPRILPSLTALFKKDIAEYLPLKLNWLKEEIGSMLTVLLIALFLESWEDIKNKGMRVYLREALMIIITVILFIGLIIYLSRRTKILEKNASSKSKTDL